MKPVEQTQFGWPKGNCFHACVASILELPLSQIPHFQRIDENWFDEWADWLRPKNLTLLTWKHADNAWTPPGYAMLGVDSPRGNFLHSVLCFDGKIVWDPSPVRHQGVGTWRDWTVFYLLDPAKPVEMNA